MWFVVTYLSAVDNIIFMCDDNTYNNGTAAVSLTRSSYPHSETD